MAFMTMLSTLQFSCIILKQIKQDTAFKQLSYHRSKVFSLLLSNILFFIQKLY